MPNFPLLDLYAIGLCVALAAIVLFFWRRVRRIDRTLLDFAGLVRQVREGEAPIEELGHVARGLAPVADEIKELLHELRQQKQSIAELNREVAQRIENRTSALQRLVESLRQQATRDALTGLYNRRMLDQLLPQLVRQCLADKAPLSMLVIDVENFRHLTDTHGMTAGEEMLKTFGQIVRSTLRENDVAFRYGENEFVLVFPGYTNTAAEAVSARLGSLLRSMAGTHTLRTRPELCVGFCALADLVNPSAENLLRGAGEALAENKSAAKSEPGAEKRLAV
jgi:diguanylate cyclase (GGDEF)-like protein